MVLGLSEQTGRGTDETMEKRNRRAKNRSKDWPLQKREIARPVVATFGLNFEALFVWYKFAAFQIAAKEAQIHGPAVAGGAPVLVLAGPASVIKNHACRVVAFWGKSATDARALPVFVRVR